MFQRLKLAALVLLSLSLFLTPVSSHVEFTTTGCLAAHNVLRNLHENTLEVQYDTELEKTAKEAADFLALSGDDIDNRPTRPLPKRRRKRSHDDSDIDARRHIESWDGDIYYPDNSVPKKLNANYGESIHKFCCTSQPHCPKEFFHGLDFPPSAEGVVNDFYNEEINSYDFATGQKKAQFYTRVKHFTNIVWKSTTKIGCAQSAISRDRCVYTVIHYRDEGSVGGPDAFKQNVNPLKAEESDDGEIVTIFLIIFFIVLLIVLIVLCYCCRGNLREKYLEIKIKTDTMKAEQELETNSTAYWWMRSVKNNKKMTTGRLSSGRSTIKHQSLKEQRPSIEVMPNTAPQRSIKRPMRVRGQSNAQSFAIMYQGMSRKAQHYRDDEQIYENTRHAMANVFVDSPEFKQKPLPNSPVEEKNGHPNLGREPSLSGKPAPPPVPTPTARQNPILPKQPVNQSPSWQKPVATTRTPSNVSNASNKPSPPTKPMMPPKHPQPSERPVPATRSNQLEHSPSSSPSVNEIRNKFNQQLSQPLQPSQPSPSNTGRVPPSFKPPLMPPGTRPR